MTVNSFGGRSTLHRLHQAVQRNIQRQHQARYDSTSSAPKPPPSNPTASRNASSAPSPPPPPQQRTIPTSASWIDPLLRPFRAYGRMQHRSPLTTQFESTLVIWFLGDLASQTVASNVFVDDEYEPIRGLRAMLIGAGSSIPGYKWFIFLGRNFNYSSRILSLGTKVVVNQMIFTPILNTYFFGMQTLLSGGSFAEAKQRVLDTVPISWRNSWKVWPVVTAFNFTFVPWQYRNVFAGFIAIGWQTYLSWLNRNAEVKERAREGSMAPPKVEAKRVDKREAGEQRRRVGDEVDRETNARKANKRKQADSGDAIVERKT